ncbi:TIM-barrel domain-containing protein [Mucilaginibacter sp. CSA2-8R]|uniref:glycoside hydrolase family 31 protein n=1 Tax=Mucilaginibacter sp. CSA2-8R TaxID=3141542 RepID=UPI00315D44D2
MSYLIASRLQWLKFIVFLVLLTQLSLSAYAQKILEPRANPKAMVQEGNVRFTVLTPRLIRMEWTTSGTFTDNATFIVVNRNLPVPRFTTVKGNGQVIIKTDELELQYKIGSGKFTNQNLSVKLLDTKHPFTWTPGLKQTGNLKGTYRTLDNYDGDEQIWDKTKMELEDGLLATDGWTLIDDSKSLLFDHSDWPWVMPRVTTDHQDLYLMGYGRQYKKALFDFTQIAGRVPLPPRYAFGYWWSRYWSYSDNEVRNVVHNFEQRQLPLDVFVVDMDWHNTDSLRAKDDVFEQPKGWTGWTWNERLFPNPDGFLHWMKDQDLKVTLNLHPASGIAPFEEPYQRTARYLNFDTTGKANIPFAGSDKRFMQALFNTVLHPMEKKGVSFWWLDWQQWPNDKKIKDLNNTWWLNYTFFTDMERTSAVRPMLYHRWGGLGNHRYQIGFSGDAVISWKSLAFQPYFTSSASNVLYGYWSHDIGGHQFGRGAERVLNPELYVRWMQFGALSPIFRTHSTKSASLNKEVWNFQGEYYDALSNAIRLRYQLAPYIYTMARKTYDTGLSLCRPLYYDDPETKEAYENPSEYMFGDNLLVAPIVSAMENGIAKKKVWLPAGNNWFEWNTGALLKGGQYVNRVFGLEEYPIYVKAGAVLPTYPNVKNLSHDPEQCVLAVFPGADGATKVYEDGGNSKDYASAYAYTQVVSRHLPGRIQKITIMPRKGQYAGMALSRTYRLQLYGAEMPVQIVANGKKLNYTTETNTKDWSYNGQELSVNIPLAKANAVQQQEVTVYYSKTDSIDVNNGLVRKFRQLSKGITALKFKDAGIILPHVVGNCEETNLRLQYYPAQFYKALNYFNQHFTEIPKAVEKATNASNATWFQEYFKANLQ